MFLSCNVILQGVDFVYNIYCISCIVKILPTENSTNQFFFFLKY